MGFQLITYDLEQRNKRTLTISAVAELLVSICPNMNILLFISHIEIGTLSYGDCLEVKREYYQNCCVLGCVTQCSQSAAHSCEQFLQVLQIGFVTLGPLRHA